MFKCNRFLESSYAIYFIYLKALFWKESTGFSPGCQRCPWHLATLYSQYPERHFGRIEDGKFRGSALHTHTHTILDPHTHRGCFALEPEPLPAPGSPVLWASPAMETTPDSQQNTASFKPEKHDLLPACFQFQAMPWKGQLIWIFRKSRS